jgi:PAS domain S-box-containing protein
MKTRERAEILNHAELLDLAREGIFVRDMAGVITLWYRGAEQMYGWTKEEAVGRVSHDLLRTKFPEPLSEIEEDLLRTGCWDGELIHKRRDGGQLVVESRWALHRDDGGQPVKILEINNDVTERKRAEETLRLLSQHLQRAQDQERRRIARELHDSTGQRLAALSMNLSVITRSAATLDAQAQRALAECMTMVQGCVQEIRTLTYLLHPPMLDERGLESALRCFVDGFCKRSGMRVDLEVAPDWERPTPEMEIALFRVVQESLTNAHRHSESSTATIRLHGSKTAVCLEVEDAGKGMTGPRDGDRPEGGGVGIMGMRERIKQFGGQLEIESDRTGTTVRVTLPIEKTTT